MRSLSQMSGKTCATLVDQSRDARPELVDTTGVRKCDRNWDIRLESYLPTGVAPSNRSRVYDRSHVF
jgi:hypothetical protein